MRIASGPRHGGLRDCARPRPQNRPHPPRRNCPPGPSSALTARRPAPRTPTHPPPPLQAPHAPNAAPSTAVNAAPSAAGSSRFRDLDISSHTLQAILEVMGYETMTEVQRLTLPVILKGSDCLAKAKTGTGKARRPLHSPRRAVLAPRRRPASARSNAHRSSSHTIPVPTAPHSAQTLAFLIPTIENLLRRGDHPSPTAVRALVLSPTRELAFQIAKEAETLTQFHKGISVGCFVGGVNMSKDMTRLKSRVSAPACERGRRDGAGAMAPSGGFPVLADECVLACVRPPAAGHPGGHPRTAPGPPHQHPRLRAAPLGGADAHPGADTGTTGGDLPRWPLTQSHFVAPPAV